MSPAKAKIVAARYMTRFRCIGAACEDHCCGGWQIIVDREHYKKLEETMGKTKKERAEFRRCFNQPEAEHRSAGFHAFTRLKPDLSCVFLDKDRLCTIQRRFGEAFLPNTCCVYPRYASRIEDRVELVGELSCPEVARCCLLEEDALELVEADAKKIGRLTMRKIMDREGKTPYVRRFDDVRRVMLGLLERRRFPLSARFFFLAYLARRLGEFFRPEAEEIDEARLAAELAAMEDEEVLEQVARTFAALKIEHSVAPRVVLEVLRARQGSTCSAQYLRLVERVMQGYVEEQQRSTLEVSPSLDPEQITASYRRRQRLIPPSLGARVDLYFENYAKNFWLKEWYVRAPSVFAHTQNLIVRIAVLRFLLLSQPVLALLPTADDHMAEANRRVFDERAVEVFYTVSRMIEHDKEMLAGITQSLIDYQMLSLGHSAALLKW